MVTWFICKLFQVPVIYLDFDLSLDKNSVAMDTLVVEVLNMFLDGMGKYPQEGSTFPHKLEILRIVLIFHISRVLSAYQGWYSDEGSSFDYHMRDSIPTMYSYISSPLSSFHHNDYIQHTYHNNNNHYNEHDHFNSAGTEYHGDFYELNVLKMSTMMTIKTIIYILYPHNKVYCHIFS